MMSHAVHPGLQRRSRWPLILVVGVVLLLVGGWSALWFLAAARAETEIKTWREREAQAGRRQECQSQTIRGYPFRIEVRCKGAAFELKGSPTLQLKLPEVLAAAQIYDPNLLIAEFAGPLEVAEGAGSPMAAISWSLGQASVRGLPKAFERGSLVLDQPVARDPAMAGDNVLFKAQRVELHGRQAEGSTARDPVIETVVRLTSAVAAKLHPVAAKPIDAEIATVVRGLDDISPKPWPQRFKEWQARDGQIEIVKARLQQEDVVVAGVGTLRLSARGGLDGNVQLTVVGLEKLLKMLDIDRVMQEGQIGATISALDRLIPGLGGLARQNAAPGLAAALGQRTSLDGKPAVTFPARINDGTVFLGPFQVAHIPPLF
ncbi:MAG: DUF2125 domain-containing protein [Xanthobacteraceae bacterium]